MRTAVVVGAGGIAAATAMELAGRGYTTIHVLTRGESDAGVKLRGALDERGVSGISAHCDVTDWTSVAAACAAVPGPVHAVVYTAGARATATPGELTHDTWRQMTDIYAGGLVAVLQALETKLASGSAVVALSGTSGRRVVSPGHLAMGSAKAAMDQSIGYLAHWLAPRGVRVNAVCCGPVDTPTVRSHLAPDELNRLSAEYTTRTLAGRLARPDDVAAAVTMLCGDESRWIYGQVILADGGEELLLG
ncbi:short-chain dehydrogenase/reductase SDR [Parafrankia sp. EAN1pec]|uniref:SDR family oxidoreductase n=1 Tax=Parafrankia sp. (strain EAN1pec) TaxID=298653 RepID=UPI00005416A8|nr:short-chain dehydrogenase/reductase SDR [Frankia sp. EAN1pec]